MKDYKKKAVILLLAVLVSVTGCGLQDGGYKRTKIVLTTGFGKDEVFRIDETSCTLPEIMVYLTNTKNQYEQALGSQIWQTSYNGETLESNIKETVLARLARIKAMNLLAQGMESHCLTRSATMRAARHRCIMNRSMKGNRSF